jgi:cytochrome b subunit of formate dehydrogenase
VARLVYHAPLPPAGRFNGGQKMNARLALVGLTALYASGITILALGRECRKARCTRWRPPRWWRSSRGTVFMAVLNPATPSTARPADDVRSSA